MVFIVVHHGFGRYVAHWLPWPERLRLRSAAGRAVIITQISPETFTCPPHHRYLLGAFLISPLTSRLKVLSSWKRRRTDGGDISRLFRSPFFGIITFLVAIPARAPPSPQLHLSGTYQLPSYLSLTPYKPSPPSVRFPLPRWAKSKLRLLLFLSLSCIFCISANLRICFLCI